MLVRVAFFIDVLTPVACLSKAFQAEGIDVVGENDAIRKAKSKLIVLKKKELKELPYMKHFLQKVQHTVQEYVSVRE